MINRNQASFALTDSCALWDLNDHLDGGIQYRGTTQNFKGFPLVSERGFPSTFTLCRSYSMYNVWFGVQHHDRWRSRKRSFFFRWFTWVRRWWGRRGIFSLFIGICNDSPWVSWRFAGLRQCSCFWLWHLDQIEVFLGKDRWAQPRFRKWLFSTSCLWSQWTPTSTNIY